MKEQNWVDEFVKRYEKAGWQVRVVQPAASVMVNSQGGREEKTVSIHLDFGQKKMEVLNGIVE